MRYRLLIPMLLMAACVTLNAQNDEPLNLEFIDRLNPVNTDSLGPNSALWGYVAPDGREYALFGSQIGTHIIDITATPIRQVAFIPGPRSVWREMKVYGHYAYIVTESVDPGKGLQIVDLAALPVTATLVRTDSALFNRAHTVFINKHYLYVMGTQADAGANGGAIIYDLEPDPLQPRRLGMVNPYYYHDAWERNDTLLGAAINGPGCDIYDVSDREHPKRLANIAYPFSGTHNAEITSDGGYVVTSDEIGATPKTMKVWDIHDLENISKVAEFTPNQNDIVHNVHVRGRYVIAAWYTAGVRIIDMIDPRHPREVARYDTYPGSSGGYNGVWEAYGFFPSGKVIASDRQTGLYVLKFNNATAGSISGVVRNKITNDPLPGVTINVGETGGTIVTDADGRFYVGGPNGAKRTLRVGPFGYAGQLQQFTLDGDQQQDMLLDPLELLNLHVRARDRKGNEIRDFSFAVEPYLHSSSSAGAVGTLLLPRDSVFTLVVGKWGYAIERVQVRLTASSQDTTITLTRRYQDDATLNLGWSFEDPNDNASTGRWTRLVPYYAFTGSDWIFPPTEPSGDPTGFVFQTGAPLRDAPAQNSDVNGGHTTLMSPPMDLHDHPSPWIAYDYWFVHYKRDTVRDTMVVQLSGDNGASWQTVRAYTEGRPGWKRDSIEVGAYIPINGIVRIRYRASDTLSNAYVMAGIDNFDVLGFDANASVDAGSVAGGMYLRAIPNPIGRTGVIALNLPHGFDRLRVSVVDAAGRTIAELHNGPMPAGEHRFPVGDALAAGVYRVVAVDAIGGRWSCPMVVVQ